MITQRSQVNKLQRRAAFSGQQVLQHGNKTNVGEVSNPYNASEVIHSPHILGVQGSTFSLQWVKHEMTASGAIIGKCLAMEMKEREIFLSHVKCIIKSKALKSFLLLLKKNRNTKCQEVGFFKTKAQQEQLSRKCGH